METIIVEAREAGRGEGNTRGGHAIVLGLGSGLGLGLGLGLGFRACSIHYDHRDSHGKKNGV